MLEIDLGLERLFGGEVRGVGQAEVEGGDLEREGRVVGEGEMALVAAREHVGERIGRRVDGLVVQDARHAGRDGHHVDLAVHDHPGKVLEHGVQAIPLLDPGRVQRS